MKNIIVFINSTRPGTREAISGLEKHLGFKIKTVVLVNRNVKEQVLKATNFDPSEVDSVIEADFDSITSINEALNDIKGQIIAITCHFENSIGDYMKIVPFSPYLNLPTESSLLFSTDKIMMRQLFDAYDPAISVHSIQLLNPSEQQLQLAEETLNYPMVIKPSGLAGSQLVTRVDDRRQLRSGLENVFSRIAQAYDQELTKRQPSVLVEDYLDGEMYSVDVYIDSRGRCIRTPFVHIITGKSVGFDDFFGYMRTTPTALTNKEMQAASITAELGIRSLGLRSTTAHVELKLTSKCEWKILEIGPRIGGYRHEMYMFSYGINHIANDILVRLDLDPVIRKPEIPQGFTAVFNFYAKTEGKIVDISGTEKLKEVSSMIKLSIKKQVGDSALFAKNNGEAVVSIIMFNKVYETLMNDRAKIEKYIKITTEPF